jgi:hypothetical protein
MKPSHQDDVFWRRRDHETPLPGDREVECLPKLRSARLYEVSLRCFALRPIARLPTMDSSVATEASIQP